MNRMNTTLVSFAATLLLSGTAFAAGVQPDAGEAPYFQPHQIMTGSQVQRADVRAQAVAQAPLAGNLPAPTLPTEASTLTRAQVRAEAVEHMPTAGIGPVFNSDPVVSFHRPARSGAEQRAAVVPQPAAGEAPLFNQVADTGASTVERAQVRADAAAHMPAAGELNAQAAPEAASPLSRAAVREATRDAIADGFQVQSGNLS